MPSTLQQAVSNVVHHVAHTTMIVATWGYEKTCVSNVGGGQRFTKTWHFLCWGRTKVYIQPGIFVVWTRFAQDLAFLTTEQDNERGVGRWRRTKAYKQPCVFSVLEENNGLQKVLHFV